jgi:hypothetical protein
MRIGLLNEWNANLDMTKVHRGVHTVSEPCAHNYMLHSIHTLYTKRDLILLLMLLLLESPPKQQAQWLVGSQRGQELLAAPSTFTQVGAMRSCMMSDPP